MNLSRLVEESLVNNDTDYEDYVDSNGTGSWTFFIFLGILMMIAGILVLALNSLCLFVLHRTTAITESTKVFMISLNSSDLILGVAHILPTAVLYMVGHWPFGIFICRLYTLLGNVLFDASLLSLLLLTIDRYIGTFFPLRYPSLMTMKRSRLLVCAVWILLFIQVTLLYMYIFNDWHIEENVREQCLWPWQRTQQSTIILVVQITVPTVLITVLYIKMMLTALKHAQRINQEEQAQNHLEGNRSYKAHRKSLTTVVIVSAALYVSFIPTVITNVMEDVFKVDIPEEVSGIVYIFHISNSWLNVIIYFLRNKELRKEALKALKC